MMQTLTLQLFGLPQIMLDDEPIHALLANKARALLFYLAVNRQTYTREALAALLWPEATEEQGRRSLRELLFITRKWLNPYLLVTRYTVAFNPQSAHWLDVNLFRQGLQRNAGTLDMSALRQAVELYCGEFLQGFAIRESADFEVWLTTQRQQFAEMQAQALEALADHALALGDYTAGLANTQRLLRLDPCRESAHRQQMLLLTCNDQRSAALAQYAACQQALLTTYNTPPSAETVTLYKRIQSGALEKTLPLASSNALPMVSSTPAEWVNWNAIPNLGDFYGRRQELDLLQCWVQHEQKRLITLFGMAGQGKSALIAQFVRCLAAQKEGIGHKAQGAEGKACEIKHKTEQAQQAVQVRFERVIWRSLKEAPPLTELIKSWLHTLTGQPQAALADYADAQIDYLLDVLDKHPTLLILDQAEALLQSGRWAGYYRPEYTAYADLFRRLVENQQRSCLILISRERPVDFARLETQATGVQAVSLAGLTSHESCELLQSYQLTKPPEALTHLVWRYGGHPLALSQVATLVQEFFAGDLPAFLQTQAFIFDELRELLDQQFERLLPQEKALLGALATERRPVPLHELWTHKWQDLAYPLGASGDILEAARSLARRGLLEQRHEGFALAKLLATYLMTCQPIPQPAAMTHAHSTYAQPHQSTHLAAYGL